MKNKNIFSDENDIFWLIGLIVFAIALALSVCSSKSDLILDKENVPQDIASTEEYYREQGYTTENFDGFLIVRKIQGE